MVYYLKHFDDILMKFSADADSSDPGYRILWINEDARSLLPLSLTPEEAGKALSDRHRKNLRKLLEFRFKRHPRYNLPAGRLKMIERQIQRRAKYLLNRMPETKGQA